MTMRALLSVSDKNGIISFAGVLESLGFEIISTGGTYRALKSAKISVTPVSEYTGFPEILEGRVKTLHPKIFSGILAGSSQDKELKKYSFERIHLVCVNFYPFWKKKNPANIDVGGVALLRAAAKNCGNVIPVCDPEDYGWIAERLKEEGLTAAGRRSLAAKAFSLTAWYDSMISSSFEKTAHPEKLALFFDKEKELRYGENPHQKAVFYRESGPKLPFRQLRGKELSFNNILDINAGIRLIRAFDKPFLSAIIKHTVPCGLSWSENAVKSFEKAYNADPRSPYGGVSVFNFPVNRILAERVSRHFFEVLIAPGFDGGARDVLKKKEKLILIEYRKTGKIKDRRHVNGGLLMQDEDSFSGEQWETVSRKKPSPKMLEDLKFAWKTVRFLKSNGIALVKDQTTVGMGSGDTSRIGAVKIALSKLEEFHTDIKRGIVLASDGFFPFPDSVIEASGKGVEAFIIPGGSKNDSEVIRECDKRKLVLIFTRRRHFLH